MPDYLWKIDESAPRKAALSPLLLLEGVYRLGAVMHRKLYAWGLWKSVRLDPGVISVGNLSVGGSGKSPVVGWLAAQLHARGRKVAVLSRGVGGRLGARVNVVSDGEHVLLSPADVGDEPVMLAGRLRGVPVLAGRNRIALGLRAASALGAEVLILDDGFQHHRLKRDIELVCIDANLGLGNAHVLPRGPLREPPGALSLADAILWTRVSEDQELPSVPSLPARAPQFRVAIEPSHIRWVASGDRESTDQLQGKSVGMLAAIARPDRLAASLERLGARVLERCVFPDHHRYRRSDLAGLSETLLWVTTEKDAVKIPVSWAPPRLVTLEESVHVNEASALLDFILQRLEER